MFKRNELDDYAEKEAKAGRFTNEQRRKNLNYKQKTQQDKKGKSEVESNKIRCPRCGQLIDVSISVNNKRRQKTKHMG